MLRRPERVSPLQLGMANASRSLSRNRYKMIVLSRAHGSISVLAQGLSSDRLYPKSV